MLGLEIYSQKYILGKISFPMPDSNNLAGIPDE
jgi:hypothetical protein